MDTQTASEARQTVKSISFGGHSPHSGTLEYPGGQVAFLEAALTHYSTMGCFGRSAGKTACILFLALAEANLCKELYEFLYASPTNRLSRTAYLKWKVALRPLLNKDPNSEYPNGCSDVDQILVLRPFGKNKGVRLQFGSLHEPDNLRGLRFHRVVVDEGADVTEYAIYAVLSPMLLGREGKIAFIGTPKKSGVGAAWWTTEYYEGLDPDKPHKKTVFAPSMCNPFLTDAELQTIIENCPDEDTLQEEVYAKILSGEGAVFSCLDDVFSIKEFKHPHRDLWVAEEPDEGLEPTPFADGIKAASYIIGYDVGRSVKGDPSILSIFNVRTRHQVALRRMLGLPFPEQIAEVSRLRRHYNNAMVLYDSTGIGKGISDVMSLEFGDYALPITWTAHRKEADITQARFLCQYATEDRGWHLIDCPLQREEFTNYQVITKNKAGEPLRNPRYGAPPGSKLSLIHI